MKLNYEEGTLFAVPLRQEGFAVGLVARTSAEGKIILVYLFCKKYLVVPVLRDLDHITPNEACKIVRIGDLGLLNGNWPIIGKITNWDRSKWPMPSFIRSDDVSRRAWKVQYSDADPNILESEVAVSCEESSMERDCVLGYGADEIMLTKLLKGT